MKMKDSKFVSLKKAYNLCNFLFLLILKVSKNMKGWEMQETTCKTSVPFEKDVKWRGGKQKYNSIIARNMKDILMGVISCTA